MDVRFRRVASLSLLMAASMASALAKPSDPVWLRIVAPDFTIVTSLDEKRALARANEFAQYVAALRNYFGSAKTELPPLTMVVFATTRQFEEYCPRGSDGDLQPVGGFFVRHGPWAVIGEPSTVTERARHTIFHEGVHWFTNAAENPNPPWYDEGMAEVFATFRIDQGKAVWGEVIPEYVDLLHTKPLLPIEKLLFTARAQVLDDPRHTKMFYAESWAFVHMLTFGDTKLPPAALSTYAKLLATGSNPDLAFAHAFGRTYAEVDRQLYRYLDGGSYRVSRRPLAEISALHAVRATEMEVDEALGRLALAARLYGDAIGHGKAMSRRAPEDPRGHALLGLALLEKGREAAALEELELAARYGTADYQPYFQLGRAVQKAAVENGSSMAGADARRAADYYERAIERYPTFEASYDNLAGVIGFADSVNEADRIVFDAAKNRFPENRMIALGAAQVMRRLGERDAARRALDDVLAQAGTSTSAVAKFAAEIKETWEAEDFFERINELIAARQFEAALAAIDDAAGRNDPMLRAQLVSLRHQIESVQATQRMNAALSNQRWSEARRIIDAIVASDAPPATKNEVRRILAELDRRRLGDGRAAE